MVSALCLLSLALLTLASFNSQAYVSTGPGVVSVTGTGFSNTPLTLVTGDYTVAIVDQFLEINCSNKSITLPSSGAGILSGRTVIFKNICPGTNTIVASALLDGASSRTFGTNNSALTVRSDGTRWRVVSGM